MRTIAFLWLLKLLTERTCIFLNSACYLSTVPWARLCLEWTLLITSWKKCKGCRERSCAFFLSGVASRGHSFPHVAPSLLDDREKEGPRSLWVKTFWRGPKWCSEMSETGCQWLTNPFCHCRHRGHWLVTEASVCLPGDPDLRQIPI